MPEVSIIVPVYKVEKVLHYCIDSILNQSFTNFELILIDDGSPDNSGVICDEYAKNDDRIIVIHQDNGGVSSARNAGIDKAKGEYITFIDSDDFIDKNYLKILLEVKEKYINYDNVWCGFRTVDSYYKDLKGKQNIIFDINEEISSLSRKDIMTLHEKWLDAGPYCKLYETFIIKNNNLRFDVNISLGEDLLFNFDYLDYNNGKIAVINKSLYNYNVSNENSLGSKYYDNLLQIYQYINKKMKCFIDKWECDYEQIKKYYNACFFKYEVILKNMFSSQKDISKKEKYKINSSIMKSKDFKESLSKMSYKPNVLYLYAYKSGKYLLVRILDMLFSMNKSRL